MDTRKPENDVPSAHSPRQTSILGSAFATVRSFFTPERNAKKGPIQPSYDPNLSALGRDLASLNLNDSTPDSDTSYQTIDSHYDDSFKSANSTALEEMLGTSGNATAILDGTLLGNTSVNTDILTSEFASVSPISNSTIPAITVSLVDFENNLVGGNEIDNKSVVMDNNQVTVSPVAAEVAEVISTDKIEAVVGYIENPEPLIDNNVNATVNFEDNACSTKLLNISVNPPVVGFSTDTVPLSIDSILNVTVDSETAVASTVVTETSHSDNVPLNTTVSVATESVQSNNSEILDNLVNISVATPVVGFSTDTAPLSTESVPNATVVSEISVAVVSETSLDTNDLLSNKTISVATESIQSNNSENLDEHFDISVQTPVAGSSTDIMSIDSIVNSETTAITQNVADATNETPGTSTNTQSHTTISVATESDSENLRKLLDISAEPPESISSVNSEKFQSVDSILNSTSSFDFLASPLPCYTEDGNVSADNAGDNHVINVEGLSYVPDSAFDSDVEEFIEEMPLERLEKSWDGVPSFDELSTDGLLGESVLDTEDQEILQEVSDDEGDISFDMPAVDEFEAEKDVFEDASVEQERTDLNVDKGAEEMSTPSCLSDSAELATNVKVAVADKVIEELQEVFADAFVEQELVDIEVDNKIEKNLEPDSVKNFEELATNTEVTVEEKVSEALPVVTEVQKADVTHSDSQGNDDIVVSANQAISVELSQNISETIGRKDATKPTKEAEIESTLDGGNTNPVKAEVSTMFSGEVSLDISEPADIKCATEINALLTESQIDGDTNVAVKNEVSPVEMNQQDIVPETHSPALKAESVNAGLDDVIGEESSQDFVEGNCEVSPIVIIGNASEEIVEHKMDDAENGVKINTELPTAEISLKTPEITQDISENVNADESTKNITPEVNEELIETQTAVQANKEGIELALKEMQSLEPQNIPADPCEDSTGVFSENIPSESDSFNFTKAIHDLEESMQKEAQSVETELQKVPSEMSLLSEAFAKAHINDTVTDAERNFREKYALKEHLLEELKDLHDSPFSGTYSVASYSSPSSSVSGDILFASTPVESPVNSGTKITTADGTSAIHEPQNKAQRRSSLPVLTEDGEEISPVSEIADLVKNISENETVASPSVPLMDVAFLKSGSALNACTLNGTVTLSPAVQKASELNSPAPQQILLSGLVNQTIDLDSSEGIPAGKSCVSDVNNSAASEENVATTNGYVDATAIVKIEGISSEVAPAKLLTYNETIVLDQEEIAPVANDITTVIVKMEDESNKDDVNQMVPMNETVIIDCQNDSPVAAEIATVMDQQQIGNVASNQTVVLYRQGAVTAAIDSVSGIEKVANLPPKVEKSEQLTVMNSTVVLESGGSESLDHTDEKKKVLTSQENKNSVTVQPLINETVILDRSEDNAVVKIENLSPQQLNTETLILDNSEILTVALDATTTIATETVSAVANSEVSISPGTVDANEKTAVQGIHSPENPINLCETITLSGTATETLNATTVQSKIDSKPDIANQVYETSGKTAMNETIVLEKYIPLPLDITTVISPQNSADAFTLLNVEPVAAEQNVVPSDNFDKENAVPVTSAPKCLLNETVILIGAGTNLNATTVLSGKRNCTPEIAKVVGNALNETVVLNQSLEVNLNVTQTVGKSKPESLEKDMNAIEEAAATSFQFSVPADVHNVQTHKEVLTEKGKKSVAFILPEVQNIRPSPVRCAFPPSNHDALMQSALQCAEAVAALAAGKSTLYMDRSFAETSLPLPEDSFNAEQDSLTFLETPNENKKACNKTVASSPNKNKMFTKDSRQVGVLKEINDNIQDGMNMGSWFSTPSKPEEDLAARKSIDRLSTLFTNEDLNAFNTNFQSPTGPRESLYVKFDPLFAPKAVDTTIFVNASEPAILKENIMGHNTPKKMQDTELIAEIDRLYKVYAEREQICAGIVAANKAEELKEAEACKNLREKVVQTEARLVNLTDHQKLLELNQKRLEDVAMEFKKTLEETKGSSQKNREEANSMIEELIKEKDDIQKHLTSAEAAFIDVFAKYSKFHVTVKESRNKQADAEREIIELSREIVRYDERIRATELAVTEDLNEIHKSGNTLIEHHKDKANKLNALIRKEELRLSTLQDSLAKKTLENDRLSQICDDLIA